MWELQLQEWEPHPCHELHPQYNTSLKIVWQSILQDPQTRYGVNLITEMEMAGNSGIAFF